MKSKKTKTIQKISLLAALVALISMTLAVSVMASEVSDGGVKGDACYTIGDVNGDGEVTKKDALYLLYHSLFEDEYPLEQDGDFDGDKAAISGKDALHLLSLVLNPGENVNVLKEVHAYGEPIWGWTVDNGTVTATAEYSCECGAEENHEIVSAVFTEKDKTAPTCTKDGSVTYVATAVHDGVEYTAEKTVVLPATGHVYNADVKACATQECIYCDYTEAGAAHTLNLETAKEVAVDGCTYKVQYTCTTCEEWVDGESYVRHEYKAAITTEANCKTAGVKTYTCTCGVYYQEAIPVNDSHAWKAGVTDAEGVTLYTCDYCGKTKTTINAKDKTTATVDKDTLAQAGEVELNGAAVKLDSATLGELSGKVTISAEPTDTSAITGLDPELAEQIKTPVFNFTMTSDGNAVSDFGGKVTISIPYVLQANDDVDCIDVWYINDDGKTEVVQGTYSNGYVTFETDHFSYYTVTRLTPKQRCAVYECNKTTKTVAATCTTDGYTFNLCTRCAESWQSDTVKAAGHDYVEDKLAATCTTSGYTKSECSVCADKKEVVIPALGHDNTDTVVEATCTEKGYTHHVCKVCGNEETEYDAVAAGHDYKETWTWDEENLSAVVKLECQSTDCGDCVEKNAVIGISKQVAATCDDEGYIDYTAQIKVGGTIYDDVYTVTEAQLQHKVTNEWSHNALSHYKVCSLCNNRVDEATHEYDDGVVTTAPTCTKAGEKTFACACGYTTTEIVAASGHTFVNGVCTSCDFNASSCDHKELKYETVEFTEEDGFCGGVLEYEVCECGEEVHIWGFYSNCYMEYDSEVSKDANGNVSYVYTEKCEDCGIYEETNVYYVVGENCTATPYVEIKVYDKDDNLLVEKSGLSGDGEDIEHAAVIWVSEDDLSSYGMCGGKAIRTKCVCGEYEGVHLNYDCMFIYNDELSSEDASAYVCEECGTKLVRTWDEDDLGKCRYKNTSTYKFYDGDTELVSYVSENIYVYHENVKYEFELDGKVCSDGYTVIASCTECGYENDSHVQPEEGQHYSYNLGMDFSEYDICNAENTYVSECPCGERVYSNIGYSHEWTEWTYEESEDQTMVERTATCATCGLTREDTVVYTEIDDSCIVNVKENIVFKLNGKVIVTTKSSYDNEYHDYEVISAELEGETCEDGVIITHECTECGDVYTYKTSWHYIYTQAIYNLADYGMCGGTLEVYGCACGEDQWMNTYAEDEDETLCQWQYWYADEESYILKCTECGMYREEYYREKEISGCYKQYIEQYDFMNDYDVLLSIKLIRNGYSHVNEYTFYLNGDVCSDGYTVNSVCKKCGMTDSWYSQPDVDEHYSYQLEYVALADYGFCGGAVQTYGCACGEERWTNWYNDEDSCSWIFTETDENGVSWYKCLTCESSYSYSYKVVDGEGCAEIDINTRSFYDKDMKVVVSFTNEATYMSHNNQISFELDGTTCSDGYIIYTVCKDCGNSSEYYEKPSEGSHYNYRLEEYSMKDLGLCDGTLYVIGCACGQERRIDQEGGCNFYYDSWDDETNTYTYVCNTCGATKEYSYMGSEEVVNCKSDIIRTYVYYDADGEKVFEKVLYSKEDRHDYEITAVQMEGESCTDGYYVTETCTVCENVVTYYSYYHNTVLVREYDLAESGACEGAVVRLYACHCGEYQNVYYDIWSSCNISSTWNEYVDEDGVAHDVSVMTCLDCGLRYSVDSVRVIDTTTCTQTVTSTVVITVGKTAVDTFTYARTESYHDMEETVAYANAGSTNCEDGIIISYNCKNCDYGYTTNTYGHHAVPVATYDLSEYGSVCGGYLVESQCLCGEYHDIYLNNYECDFDWDSITSWLGSNYNGQYTSEGWHDGYRDAYEITCAVTDPACGFTLRTSEDLVWDEENCMMYEYEVWQIGYDATTGKCQKEIKVLDDTYAYHDYVSTSSTSSTVNTYVDTCSNCQSTHTETYEYDTNRNHISTTHKTVNTLYAVNGEPQSRTNIEEWYIYQLSTGNTVSEWSKDYYEYVYADGSVYWNGWEYTYGWENGECTRTSTSANSNGYSSTETVAYHCGYTECVAVSESTCTQYGTYNHETDCKICNQTVVSENVHEHSPNGHWYSWDSTAGIYTCSTCGLQSENGADGSVVLEDMTAKYGNNVNYVIGYWNQSSVWYDYSVCVVNDTASAVLTGIEITTLTRDDDGINAISFSKADVEAAVTASGITGDICVVFSPVGSDGDLDYAITLTE